MKNIIVFLLAGFVFLSTISIAQEHAIGLQDRNVAEVAWGHLKSKKNIYAVGNIYAESNKRVMTGKMYSANLVTVGGGTPTVSVLQSTLSGTIVWTRSSAGTYQGKLLEGFPVGKTLVLTEPLWTDTARITSGYRATDSTVIVKVSDTSVLTDGGSFSVKIETY
jgi:hypothetical protein